MLCCIPSRVDNSHLALGPDRPANRSCQDDFASFVRHFYLLVQGRGLAAPGGLAQDVASTRKGFDADCIHIWEILTLAIIWKGVIAVPEAEEISRYSRLLLPMITPCFLARHSPLGSFPTSCRPLSPRHLSRKSRNMTTSDTGYLCSLHCLASLHVAEFDLLKSAPLVTCRQFDALSGPQKIIRSHGLGQVTGKCVVECYRIPMKLLRDNVPD